LKLRNIQLIQYIIITFIITNAQITVALVWWCWWVQYWH